MSLAQLATALLEASGALPYLQWASRLSPWDHHPHLLMADLEPSNQLAAAHWARIRQLHPLYAPAWIRLGLDQEMEGRTAQAERTLLHAAAVDHTFLPQWTLANFYFRQGRQDRFWIHARRATARFQGDFAGVFQMCLRVDNDPIRVWQRLSPPGAELYRPARMDLFRVLLARERYADAAGVAALMASAQLRHTREILLDACDEALAQGEVSAAVSFWNAAANNGWIPRASLDPARDSRLADAAFQHQSTGQCFDWRMVPRDGVSFRSGMPAGLRIDLNGRQDAEAILTGVRIPVEPRRRYRFTWRYHADLSPDSAPPQWRIGGSPAATWQTVVQGAEDSFEFDAGPGRLAELALATSTAAGSTRPEGRLQLDWVMVKRLD